MAAVARASASTAAGEDLLAGREVECRVGPQPAERLGEAARAERRDRPAPRAPRRSARSRRGRSGGAPRAPGRARCGRGSAGGSPRAPPGTWHMPGAVSGRAAGRISSARSVAEARERRADLARGQGPEGGARTGRARRWRTHARRRPPTLAGVCTQRPAVHRLGQQVVEERDRAVHRGRRRHTPVRQRRAERGAVRVHVGRHRVPAGDHAPSPAAGVSTRWKSGMTRRPAGTPSSESTFQSRRPDSSSAMSAVERLAERGPRQARSGSEDARPGRAHRRRRAARSGDRAARRPPRASGPACGRRSGGRRWPWP